MKPRLMFFSVALILASAVSVFTLSSFSPQDASPQYVSLNVFDVPESFDPKIVVVYENNSTEEIKLERPVKASAIQGNAIKVHETINMLSHKGYKLVSAIRLPLSSSYVFEKRAN